jgi:hypothetical protein
VGQCFYGYKKAHRIMGFDVVAGGAEGMPTQTVFACMTNGLPS